MVSGKRGRRVAELVLEAKEALVAQT